MGNGENMEESILNKVIEWLQNCSTNITCIDPGGTTGICRWVGEEGKVETMSLKWAGLEKSLRQAILPGTVICETYIARPAQHEKMGFNSLQTSQIIGMVKMITENRKFSMISQMPGSIHMSGMKEAISYIAPRLNLDSGGVKLSNAHERDAFAHLIRFALNKASRSKSVVPDS